MLGQNQRRALLLLLLLPCAVPAAAAEPDVPCPDLPLCARLRPGVVFFIGEAVEERHRPGHRPEYRFLVREPLRGLAPPEELIILESPEGPPPTGRLLIEASREPGGHLTRGECHYARSESDVARADLALLRDTSATGAFTITLSVNRAPKAAESHVVVDGPLHRLATPSAGSPNVFLMNHLPPGDYRLTAASPGYETTTQPERLEAGACRTVIVAMQGAGTITGEVAPPARQPRPLVAVHDLEPPLDESAFAVTPDAQGHYELKGIAPGRYVVTIGDLFYPGTPDRARAAIVEMPPGGTVRLNPVILP